MRFFLLLLVAHCTGFNEVPTRCRTKNDCPNKGLCVFDLNDGCGGRGHCTQISRNSNCEIVACGCDGKPAFLVGESTQFLVQCTDGFDRPIASTDPCPK